ncbi:hypothetical protein [Vibrio hyugaensis]|uniref:hypothetical protein n=1 Tax=Vibrio hyugaensis TaxID=1534743 RepID=UPI0005EDD8F0|nr:hypothetical protein [Vibrio hyugaensis]
MLRLLQIVVLINAVAAVIVFGLSHFVPQFQSTQLSDFLFFVLVVIWVLAKMTWEGGMYSRHSLLDDEFTDKVHSMVDRQHLETDTSKNYQLGFIFFIAGLPSLFVNVAMMIW